MKPQLPEFSVTELSQVLKMTLEETFSNIKVRGEISGFKPHSSGHLYFNLKDSSSVLNTVCWKGTSTALKIKPEDGLEVICTGKISTYPARSNYQFIVSNIEVAGVGALLAMLEQRKKKLEAEGLFDISKKKALPLLPKTIGIVTSPTGAVIRDILHRISDRFPNVHVMVYGVQVQGSTAAEEVAYAINKFNTLPENIPTPDVLIVARGGGSIEDLWAFNEEIVVRATYNSRIPIISAVGHETDTTLIDYAADVRAPTPTAAAEMAVPVKAQLLQKLSSDKKRLISSLTRLLHSKENLYQKLENSLNRFKERLREVEIWLKNKGDLMKIFLNKLIEKREMQLLNLSKLLESYEYKKVLKRGFSVVRLNGGKIVSTISQLHSEYKVQIEFQDGIQEAEILKRKPQGSLF